MNTNGYFETRPLPKHADNNGHVGAADGTLVRLVGFGARRAQAAMAAGHARLGLVRVHADHTKLGVVVVVVVVGIGN